MSTPGPFRTLSDRVIVGIVIVAGAVALALPAVHPDQLGLVRLWVLAVIPLSATAVGWGKNPPGSLLFLYGAVNGAISLFMLFQDRGISQDLEYQHGITDAGMRWMLFAGTIGLGAICRVTGRIGRR